MANIVLVTHGTGGDVKPFIKIGGILKKLKHEVTVITHCVYQVEIEGKKLDFVAIDNYLEYEERMKKLCTLSDAIKNFDEYCDFNKKYCAGDQLYKEYEIIKKYCEKKNTIIICRHRFSSAALLVGEVKKIPIISLFLAPNYIQHLQFHEEIIGSIMKEEINKVRKKIQLNSIESWTNWMCSTKLKIALWPKWYAEEDIKSIKNAIAIGFPEERSMEKKDLSEDIKKFLRKEKKVVLITAGTSLAINSDFYKITMKACEELNLGVILVTDFDQFVPKKLSENTLRLRVAPIVDILPYVDAVIHHGGIGTASEALIAGVPQLILAHFADRPDNANRLKRIGVAKVLTEISWEEKIIKKEIIEIVNCEKIKKNCEKMKNELKKENIEINLDKIIEDISINNDNFLVNDFCDEEIVKVENIINKNIDDNKRKIILEILKRKNKNQ